MPSPKLSTLWRGHSPTTDEPGGYRLLRVISVASGAWTNIDLRTADYAGAADGVAQNNGGTARGIIRGLMLLNMSSTAGEGVRVSFNVTAGAPDPVTAYNVAMVDGPSLELRVPVTAAMTSFWVKADAGNPDIQMEMWYDVPPAP